MASSKLAWPHDIASPRVAGLAILGLYSLVTAIRRLKRASSPGQEVPYAAGWVPILGHLLVVRKYFKENQKILMGRWGMEVQQEQNLDIFRAEMMGLEMVIVNDPDLAEEVCNGDPHRFTKDFRSIPAGDVIKKVFGNGLFFANTDDTKWQTAHNILKTPFSTKGMKAMMPMMCNQADLLVAALKRDVGYGNATYIDSWVTKMAFETVAVCGLGTPLGCFESEETHPYVAALNGVLEQRALFFCPRVLQPLLLPGRLAQLNADCDYMRQTCIDIIRQRREQGDPGDDHRRDLLDMMLYDKDKKTGLGMTEDMIVDNVLTFLFAGQDSTAAAMASCLCFLCAYPEKKAKLLKEIDEVVGDGQFEWEHLSKMHYLDWCIKETMRLVPPAVGFMRQARGEQLLGQKWRVSGMPIVVNAMGLHYSKKLWGEDVYEFRPERWEHGQPHRFAFIPFAVGPRACIGREFTVVEQKVTMVKLFQHFDFRRPATVQPEPGYVTVRAADAKYPPFIDMDVEFKQRSAFVGIFSSFELLSRGEGSQASL